MKINFKSILNTLQTYTSATKTEIYLISLIIFGLILGLIFKSSNNERDINAQNIKNVLYKLDSIKNKTAQDTNNSIDTANKFPKYVLKMNKDLPFQKININTANKLELMSIPGIGEKTAESIINYRKNKKFHNTNELKEIKGIGEKKYEKIKEFITII